MDLVERLRLYCHALRDSKWFRVVPAMNEAADRIEDLEELNKILISNATEVLSPRVAALESALREIAAGGNWENGLACMAIARAALKDNDSAHPPQEPAGGNPAS